MNTRKKVRMITAILLVLVMMTAVFAGCTSTPDKEDTTKNEEAAKENEESKGEEMNINGLTLPLTEEKEELSVWLVYSGTIVKDINDIEGIKKMEELTNVHINWMPVNLQEIGEKYGILLSSGEYPDIIYAASNSYPGGFEKGVEDGVIYPDHDKLIHEYMPNYMSYLEISDEARREATADSGKMLVIKNIVGTDGTPQSEGTYEGMSYRQDLLEKLGVDVPTTIDEWHDVLVKAKEEGIVEAPLMLNQDGSSPLSEAWGVASRSGNYLQLEDDKVSYAAALDGYGEYLETMRQWYAEGLIDPNFTSFIFYPQTPGNVETNHNLLFSRTLSMFTGQAYKNMGMVNNEEEFLQPIAAPVLNKGDTQKYQWGTRIIAKDAIYITTSCKNPELAAKWIDFQYTEIGERLNWYGIEGETYTIGEDGTPQFTDKVTKDITPKDVLQKYTLNWGDCWLGKHNVSANWKLSSALTGGQNQELEAVNIWSEPPVNLYLTTSISLTEEEGDEINPIMTTLTTMVQEYTINYILGSETKSFDEFRDDLSAFGLQKVLDTYQAAYDRYLER